MDDAACLTIHIDGASRGNPADDVALTWVILVTSVVHGPRLFRAVARAGRSLLVDAFLSSVEHAEAAGQRVAAVAGRRLELDPHLLAPERAALQKLIAHHS